MSPETRIKVATRRRQNSEGAGAGGEADVDVKESPRIIFLGPPGAGKTTIAALMAAKYGSVLVSVDAEAKAAAEAGLEQGAEGIRRQFYRCHIILVKIRFSLGFSVMPDPEKTRSKPRERLYFFLVLGDVFVLARLGSCRIGQVAPEEAS